VDARGGAGGGHSAEHALVRVDVRLDRGVAAGVENLAADDLGDGGGRLLLQVLSLRVDGEDGDGARALAAFSQVRFGFDLFASAKRDAEKSSDRRRVRPAFERGAARDRPGGRLATGSRDSRPTRTFGGKTRASPVPNPGPRPLETAAL
jgi:hypothetical protein